MTQLELDLHEPPKWGGPREGAGRKRSKYRSDPPHRARPHVAAYHPQHVTLRCVKGVPRLRTSKVMRALTAPLRKMQGRSDFRIVHISVQENHLHLIVEASSTEALSFNMQQFTIAAARAINKALDRTGKVFAYRYHARPITSPRQARHVLAYVLNNWRHHDEDEGTPRSRAALVDPYSSALSFDGWKEIDGRFPIPAGYESMMPPVSEPTTWLLRVGWRQHYPLISVFEVPAFDAID